MPRRSHPAETQPRPRRAKRATTPTGVEASSPNGDEAPAATGHDARVEQFRDAIGSRISAASYDSYLRSADIRVDDAKGRVEIGIAGQFAAQRLTKKCQTELRAAAATLGQGFTAVVKTTELPSQTQLDLGDDFQNEPDGGDVDGDETSSEPDQPAATNRKSKGSSSTRTSTKRSASKDASESSSRRPVRRRGATRLSRLAQESIRQRATTKPAASAPAHADVAGGPTTRQTMDRFVAGSSNALAHTAAGVVCAEPGTGPLVYLSGPSGVGKTHLVDAIADVLRRRHRMKRVLKMSAEQFTNEFVAVVGSTGITGFRSRTRDVDALLIDDVHFLAKKRATIRELVHTIGDLAAAGKTMIFTGDRSPHQIDGLSTELAGRLTGGLVCAIAPMCEEVRRRVFLQFAEERLAMSLSPECVDRLVPMLPPDGRAIGGVVNAIHLSQRMSGRSPDWAQLREHCGHLLRGTSRDVDLRSIETAVCELFGLKSETLRSGSQARAVSQPRMLAMYLSRQKTSSAYTEIAKHFNIRSHTTAMAAEKNVQRWLSNGAMIGRGPAALPIGEAVEKLEQLLSRSA